MCVQYVINMFINCMSYFVGSSCITEEINGKVLVADHSLSVPAKLWGPTTLPGQSHMHETPCKAYFFDDVLIQPKTTFTFSCSTFRLNLKTTLKATTLTTADTQVINIKKNGTFHL